MRERGKKRKKATEEHLEVKLTAWPTVQQLFLGWSPLFFLCQVLKRPCHIKWQISGHLTFLPNPLGGCSVFNDIVCFLSSQLGAEESHLWKDGAGKKKCLEGQRGMLGWVSDFGAGVWRIGAHFVAFPPTVCSVFVLTGLGGIIPSHD